jgi:hypothetical protein
MKSHQCDFKVQLNHRLQIKFHFKHNFINLNGLDKDKH